MRWYSVPNGATHDVANDLPKEHDHRGPQVDEWVPALGAEGAAWQCAAHGEVRHDLQARLAAETRRGIEMWSTRANNPFQKTHQARSAARVVWSIDRSGLAVRPCSSHAHGASQRSRLQNRGGFRAPGRWAATGR